MSRSGAAQPRLNFKLDLSGIGIAGNCYPWPSLLMVDRQLTVRYVPLDSLRPYARNARTHSKAQLGKLAASLMEFGWTVPMAVAGSEMIAGHGRLAAALTLRDEGKLVPGLTDAGLGPVIDLSHLSPEQRRAYVVADNRLALDAGWDLELLALELQDLREGGFDLALTGFEMPELSRMFGGQTGDTDPDDVPKPEPIVISRRGDVWTLGRHRIMCGDSTNQRDLDTLMNGKLADVCFTSPPYAQQRDYKSGEVDWNALMQDVFGKLPLRHEGQLLVNLGLIHRDSEWVTYWDGWVEWMREAGWRKFGWYVWDQGPGLPGDHRGRLAPSHEFIFHFNKKIVKPRYSVQKKPENVCDRSNQKTKRNTNMTHDTTNYTPLASLRENKILDSVVRVMRHKGDLGDSGRHPAVFPVNLPGEMMLAFSDPDDLIFEPFSGSGSVLIAAEREQRVCYGMEIAPEYIDVTVRRWQTFTGQPARLESTSRTFEEVGAAREVTPAPAAA